MRKEVKNEATLLLSNELVLSRVYGTWALVCVVLFGFIAVGPLVTSIVKKVALYNDMREINYALNVKLQSMSKLSDDITAAEKYEYLLESTIPKELNTHTYMVAFMQQAAIAGFSVRNFTPATESIGGAVPVGVILEGSGDLSALISGIEGMQRVTVVDSVKYEIHPNSTETSLSLRIFNL